MINLNEDINELLNKSSVRCIACLLSFRKVQKRINNDAINFFRNKSITT